MGFNEAQVMAWVSPLFWPFVRVLALFSVAPLLSNRVVPVRVRIALAFFVALGAQPGLAEQPLISDPRAASLVMEQVLIGLVMGFAARVAFASIELAGELIGLQMGLNFAGFFSPGTGDASNAVARLMSTLAALLFVASNCHLLLLAAVLHSFDIWPAGAGLQGLLSAFTPARLGTELFYMAFWMALPVIGLLLFVNLALGIVSRVAPQFNIFGLGFAVTLSAGLTGLALTLPFMQAPMQGLLERAVAEIR